MFLSIFDIFKIGIGPSSSHTVGPMVAAKRFLDSITPSDSHKNYHITASLHGSLAFTGKGHASDKAIILGLYNHDPVSINATQIDNIVNDAYNNDHIIIHDIAIAFQPQSDIIFDYEKILPEHSNGMIFTLYDGDNIIDEQIYYSVGGGFVNRADEMTAHTDNDTLKNQDKIPYLWSNAKDMLMMGDNSGLTIAQMKRANETTFMSDAALDTKIDYIWQVMNDCIDKGLATQGSLPGGLNVKRRAHDIHQKLLTEKGSNQIYEHLVMDWLSVYAMAVNEENAAGSKIVTAPTNGAAGVIPAVMRYYRDHCALHGDKFSDVGIRDFMLTAAAIGSIIKYNASISGAEVGCQGEVGSASAMAAAGLCAALGGTNMQIENAAEIALEHHLGMTCDPIGGLVQVPCIERNAFGAIKAVTAASMALRGDGTHFVPLDDCIKTMRETGLDMNEKYKETSQGGLAANVVEC